MTPLERRLLNEVQKDFPLQIRPFRSLGKRLGISEKRCISLLGALTERGILRAIKPVFAWKKLGFESVLVGMEVDDSSVTAVADVVGRAPGVTHNYLRKGPLNLWFTFTCESKRDASHFVKAVRALPGVKRCRKFPSLAIYKIGLVLDV
jgi:DNA-binding Lrp family transcriptional regulator